MTTVAESTTTASSPWWWTHCSVEDAVEPLDPTADDAAADCLASISAQTAQHIITHAEVLRPYLTSPPADTIAVAAEKLYAQLGMDAVLIPLLSQLRKAMARAWEERIAEQAEAAAVEGLLPHLHHNSNNTVSPSLRSAATQESANVVAARADPVLLRRLRVLQQQIYIAFLKTVLQGLTSGIRTAVMELYRNDESSSTAQTEFPRTENEDAKRKPHATSSSDRTAHGLALLLDGLFARLMGTATSASTTLKTLTSSSTAAISEDARKARRAHYHSSSSSAVQTSSAATDWFTGMIPLYMRAAQHSTQTAEGESGNETTLAPTWLSIPSPALCLVSYVGAFLQDAGLQILPSEQAAQLPLFTALVHCVFLSQLQERCAATMAEVSTSASGEVAAADVSAVALAHIKSAIHFLQHLTDAQLYKEEHNMEMEEDDCTALFRAPAPPSSTKDTKAAEDCGTTVVDYSVASLLALTTYEACSPMLSNLEKWWTACSCLLSQARAAAQAPSGNTEGQIKEKEKGKAELITEQVELERGVVLLKEAEDAWLALRRNAMAASVILSNYADTTLLLVPYIALMSRLFFSSPSVEDNEERAEPSHNAWKACIRELHHATRTTYSGKSIGASGSSEKGGAAAGMMSARPLRPHYRNVGSCTFASASYLRVPTVLSDAAVRAVLAATETTHPTGGSGDEEVTPKVLPLAFSLLHQPLTVLQERLLHMLITPSAVISHLKADTIVGEKGSVADRSTPSTTAASATHTPLGTDVSHTSTAVAAAATSARARAASDQPITAAEIVELSFPRHYRLLHAVDLVMQYWVSRSQKLAKAVSPVNAWASATDSISSLFVCFFGAVLDEMFVTRMRNGNDEVCASELLMFYAAVFRTLPPDSVPYLRAALTTFLGQGGTRLLDYLRHHIVDQERYGLAAFFLPPLRALGLDYSTVEDTEISLALAAKPSYAAAMAYAWELPRLFFWKSENTPVAELAWNAHLAAQQYLCELMSSEALPAFRAILVAASAVAHKRCGKAREDDVKRRALSTSQVAATDAMTAVFLGVCRWCAAQLSAVDRGASSFSSVLSRESIRTVLTTQREGDTAMVFAPHPFLLLLQTQLRETGTKAASEGAATEDASTLAATNTSAFSLFSSRVVEWLWTSTYDEVASVHLQTCAKRLLRDFSVQFGRYAPFKTVLGIRAMVEQKMKVEEVAVVAAAQAKLEDALSEDLTELVLRQQKQEMKTEAIKATADATLEHEEDNAVRHETVTGTAPSPPSITPATTAASLQKAASSALLAPAELRRYVDRLLHALVTRAQLSPVDGAISSAALGLLLRALSGAQLPIQMTPQDRQRMCERFVFTLTSALPDLTRVEALSCACSLHLVLDEIVFPFKKSFLETTPSRRLFHGCLSDNEADAFKMVQRTLGDVVTAFHKCRTDAGSFPVLSDWKAIFLLEQMAPFLSIVRSLLEKVRVMIRTEVLNRKTLCAELLHQQVTRMERESTREGGGVADDVFHLYTHHSPSPPSVPSNASTSAIKATTTADSSPSIGKRADTASELRNPKKSKRSGRREREKKLRRAEMLRKKEAAAAQGSGSGHKRNREEDERNDDEHRRSKKTHRGDSRHDRRGRRCR